MTAEEAVRAAKNGAIAETQQITVRSVSGEPYERIIDYVLGEKPEPLSELDRETLSEAFEAAGENVPF